MRVRVNEKIKIFHGHVPTQLEVGQEVGGSLAAMLLAQAPGKVTRLDGSSPASDPEPPPPVELDLEATAAEVLAWVGEDPERAAQALTVEEAREKPRSTLLKQLDKLVDGK